MRKACFNFSTGQKGEDARGRRGSLALRGRMRPLARRSGASCARGGASVGGAAAVRPRWAAGRLEGRHLREPGSDSLRSRSSSPFFSVLKSKLARRPRPDVPGACQGPCVRRRPPGRAFGADRKVCCMCWRRRVRWRRKEAKQGISTADVRRCTQMHRAASAIPRDLARRSRTRAHSGSPPGARCCWPTSGSGGRWSRSISFRSLRHCAGRFLPVHRNSGVGR